MAETATVFAFLNSAIKFSEVALKLCSVGSENAVFVRLILRVRNDLEEVERLISTPTVKKKLISTPGKLPWIKGVVFSTKSALNDIGQWVDRVRADKEGYGSISFENRVRWVFKDHDKLTNRSLELSTNHQSLSNVLQYLMPLERDDGPQSNNDREPSPPTYHDATYLDEIMPMSSRQRRQVQYRKSQLDLRGSNEGGPREVFRQTSQHQTHLCPIPQTSFEEERSSSSNNLASQASKLRQAKSSISLAQSYQETPQITPRASFYNASTAGLSSQHWENDSFSRIFNSPSYAPMRPLSSHSTVSSVSTLNRTEIWNTPKPDTGQGNLSETLSSPTHWSLSPDQLSPRTPVVLIEESHDTLQPQISGTNSIGPVNAFDMFLETEKPEKPQKTSPHPTTEQNLQVKTPSPREDVSEIMDNLSLSQIEQRESFAELPAADQFRTGNYSSHSSFIHELPVGYPEVSSSGITKTKIPLQEPIEFPYNAAETSRPEYITQVQPSIDTGQQSAFASSAPPPQFGRLDQSTQAQFQYPHYPTYPQQPPQNNQFRTSMPSPYAVQYPQSQPSFQNQGSYQPHQTQYQAYRPPLQSPQQTSPNLPRALSLPANSYLYTPSPTPLTELQHQSIEASPRGPEAPGYTAASLALPSEQQKSLSRSETLSETRRRNQRLLLGLLR